MLLIATAVPAVESLKNSAINATVPSTPLASMAANWTEMQKLLASDGAVDDEFGYSVSLSGDTALIGAGGDDGKGSAYVFTRTGTTWSQQAKLLASDGAAEDFFGLDVSLSGDTALIGAPGDDDNGVNSGSAYVFIRTGTTWSQQQKLLASDGAAYDYFGYSVSLDGNTALIGARGDESNTGSAYVFTRTGTTWAQQTKLLASDGGYDDRFGWTVSLDGDTALIAAPLDDISSVDNAGSAYVFTRTGTTWTQQAKLLASDGAINDCFGWSVSLDGNTALIGVPFGSGNENSTGSAYVFTRTGTTWIQQQKLFASDGAADDFFGWTVALADDTALIGAQFFISNQSGSAYVFTRIGTTWTQQQKLNASDGAAEDYFGWSVALDGNTALIGAYNDDDNGNDSGSAYVFTKEGGTPGLTFDITGGLGVNIKITNNGTVKATVVDWQIHVEGGILGKINKTINDTVDIPAGQSRTVGTGLFFGLGPITITAKVADEEKTAEGTYLFIFSMVK